MSDVIAGTLVSGCGLALVYGTPALDRHVRPTHGRRMHALRFAVVFGTMLVGLAVGVAGIVYAAVGMARL